VRRGSHARHRRAPLLQTGQQARHDLRLQAGTTRDDLTNQVVLADHDHPVEGCPDVAPTGQNEQRNDLGRW